LLAASLAWGQAALNARQDAAAQSIALATHEVQRMKDLVQLGVEAPIRLVQAEQDLADAQDAAILERAQLTEKSGASDPAEEDAVAAAQRRVDRQKERIEQRKKLIDGGLLSLSDLNSFDEELSRRQLDLYWVQLHVQYRDQATSLAKLKNSISDAQQSTLVESEELFANGMEHYAGEGDFDESRDLKPLAMAFAIRFDRVLPISADGETELHRTLGFDHRGRIDVAVNPLDADGLWLRRYLRSRKIPYYAFTRAIPGKATAAHIHIGPGSTALLHSD
jgi:hypothetical protein